MSILKTQGTIQFLDLDSRSAHSPSDESNADELATGTENRSVLAGAPSSVYTDDHSQHELLSGVTQGTITTPASALSYHDEPLPLESEELFRKFREERIVSVPFYEAKLPSMIIYNC